MLNRQLVLDGSWPAGPSKSSAKARVQPGGVAGTLARASAVIATRAPASSTVTLAPASSLVQSLAGGIAYGLMNLSLVRRAGERSQQVRSTWVLIRESALRAYRRGIR